MNNKQKFKDSNPNWRGGICSITTADEILDLPNETQTSILARVHKYVRVHKKSGCWLWQGMVFTSNGRARIAVGKNTLLASRVVYVLYNGKLGKKCVLHTCDNVLCVNPQHLKKGTNKDNSQDMVKKGRSLIGERNAAAKLTEKEVLAIRYALKHKIKKNILAKKYGVCDVTIGYIETRKTWTHI